MTGSPIGPSDDTAEAVEKRVDCPCCEARAEREDARCCWTCWEEYVDRLPDDAPFTSRIAMGMFLCPMCDNKRCPTATNHRHACTGSNELGQRGSRYRNGCGLWLGKGLTAGPCTEPAGHDNGKHDPEETQR